MSGHRHRDQGSTLILTLILTVVMAVIVMAIASYATAGLRASDATTNRTLSNIDTSNVASWVVEEFAKRQIDPYVVCGEAPVYNTVDFPESLVDNGSSVTARCARTAARGGHLTILTYHLVVEASGERTRTVEALIEVPTYSYGAWVEDWRVDLDIFAEAPGTTVPPTSTTLPPSPPGAFVKTAPQGAGQPTTATVLSWETSVGAARYEWCVDTVINDSCDDSWTATTATSAALGTLAATTDHEWQVRAVNADGSTLADGGTWWTFTTGANLPGTFGKIVPQGGGQNRTGTVLRWNPSADADSYEWCLDNVRNGSCDGNNWISTTETSVTLGTLAATTDFEWQVRAVNEQGSTLADGGFWWEFKTKGGQP